MARKLKQNGIFEFNMDAASIDLVELEDKLTDDFYEEQERRFVAKHSVERERKVKRHSPRH